MLFRFGLVSSVAPLCLQLVKPLEFADVVTEGVEVTTLGSITPRITLGTGLHLRAGQAQDDSYTEYGLDRHLSVSFGCRNWRFLVAFPPVRDLLFCAKHLFVAAMMVRLGCGMLGSTRAAHGAGGWIARQGARGA